MGVLVMLDTGMFLVDDSESYRIIDGALIVLADAQDDNSERARFPAGQRYGVVIGQDAPKELTDATDNVVSLVKVFEDSETLLE